MSEPVPELVSVPELAEYQAGDPALLLAHAEGLVRGYCGWHIAPSRSETLTVAGEGTPEVQLPTLFLTDVIAVYDDGAAVDMLDVDWWTNGRLTRLDACGVWTAGPRKVVADVEHGYEVVPYDVRAVVSAIAARTTVTPGGGVRSETAGGVSITYADGASSFTADELRVLDRYRIWRRP